MATNYEEQVKEIWELYHSIEPALTSWVYARSSKDTQGQEKTLEIVAELTNQFLMVVEWYNHTASYYPEDDQL